MNPAIDARCYALLDDASAAPGGAASRLYTGHLATLSCADGAGWTTLLEQMQQALRQGRHAVVLCAYELGAHLMGMPARADADAAPLARVLLFETCQRLSQAGVAAWLAARAAAEDAAAAAIGAAIAPAGIAAIRANVDQREFGAALARIHDYIEAGDTYQVNYTYRLRFDAFGSPLALYTRLRARQPVPYGALVALPDGGAVLSLSPELFVRHQDGRLTARPMKGTAPAAAPGQAAENARRAAALAADPKNRAENLMIVDLLRNDIGRIAATGTVQVPALFEVQRYSSVLQMTSTVRATLRAGAGLAEIFRALYPCGSITGAPKRRTMEIIDELEPAARGLYTGAIGWFEPPPAGAGVGDFCLSVPIRTLALRAPADGVRAGEMGVGAGIVYDSDAADEYAECQLKAGFLTGLTNDFELFESMHASRDGGCRHVGLHLARLAASARYFGFECDLARARATLDAACAALAPGLAFRLRLALTQNGALNLQSGALTALAEPVRLLLAEDATRADDLFLRHKTSVRARYDAAWRAAEAQGAFDTLFFNERGELTEGGRSNVFVKLDGRWHTPPLASGVLPGILRGVLLADPAWGASERVISRAELLAAPEIVVCNALRGPLKASIERA
ncbi:MULTISPECIES: aminodeoxychorismate synthase component I [unclassified Janthinobacterium]|uniref:aminodeoxychorismate synthase component I n=1 Tax=unclassified Janthinobacterium TaxID=2610881 RepID=UPI00034C5314|nr:MULTISPECIES: aminodeoxychorismate synthase component I [unclassified Janthinobacterium]MEC5159961.1 para-aminobenzoate synthetase/4-amino-4-deoxychorismate lyase [Janthinobacterium sp. CG_S6]